MSFNTLGSKAWDFGGNTPVWLGKVRPVPFGGTLKKAYLIQNALYQAGMPVNLSADTNGEITPVVAFKVTAHRHRADEARSGLRYCWSGLQAL